MNGVKLRIVVCTLVLSLLFGTATWALEAEGDANPNDAGRVVLYIDGIEENTDAQIAEYKPQFDGQDVKLSIDGEYAEALRFLKAMDFNSLDLYWKLGDLYLPSEESGNIRRLCDVPHIRALTIPDRKYGYYNPDDAFPELEQLTLLCSGEPALFGSLFDRTMPSLQSITVQTEDAGDLFYAVTDYMIFPSGLTAIDIYENGELAPAESLDAAKFKGSLLYCCPDALVNGMTVQSLPVGQSGDLSPEEQVNITKTNAAAVATLDGAYYGSLPVSQELPPVNGKLLFMQMSKYGPEYYIYDYSYGPFEIGWTYMEEATAEEKAETFGSDSDIVEWREREVPADMLASGLDDADTMVIIFEDEVPLLDQVVYDTDVVIKDLRSGTVYAPYSIFPSLGETEEYDTGLATRQVMQSYGGTVAQAQAGRVRFTGASAAAGTGAENLGDDALAEVLLILNDPAYAAALEALDGGETITQGMVSDSARGLQQMLVGFGCNIAVDGSAGPGTFAALNSVLESLGMEPAEAVDASLYRELLPLLLLTTDEEAAKELLLDEYATEEDAARLEYMRGCLLFGQEKYYRAKEAFENSRYQDYLERAEACNQSWPQNGEMYHNPNYYSQNMFLTFDVNSPYDDRGMFFEVYSESGDLAVSMFLTGSGKVSTGLPGGNYRIKCATGYDAWYGTGDAFGPDGDYEDLLFYEFEGDDTLTSLPGGAEWIISMNTGNTGGTGVGSTSTSWNSR